MFAVSLSSAAIMKSVSSFTIIMMVLLTAFTFANFHLLAPIYTDIGDVDDIASQHRNLWTSFVATFAMGMVGEFDSGYLYDRRPHMLMHQLMFVTFITVISIVLLNLLIGVLLQPCPCVRQCHPRFSLIFIHVCYATSVCCVSEIVYGVGTIVRSKYVLTLFLSSPPSTMTCVVLQ